MLSIIIVNYNTKDLVLECIRSIKVEGSKITKEIIIVDNGSSDGSASKFKSIYKNDNSIKILENDSNLGFAKGNNIGMKAAKGEYILLLNSDTLVKKNSLGKLVEFAELKPDAGVVGPKLLNIDGSFQPSVSHFPSIINAIREYWLGQKGGFELYTPNTDEPLVVDAVVGAAFLITPSALKKVGLLNERYFFYYEDLDYCRRARDMSLKVYFLPTSQVIHYLGASGKNIAKPEFQWRRLITSSKIYNGILTHYLINFIIWSGQKWQKLLK